MSNKAIVYGSTNGATKVVCEFLSNEIDADLYDVKDVNPQTFTRYDFVILATPSYAKGVLQDDWLDKISLLDSIEGIENKTFALVGVGNQARHGDTFCSAIVDFLPKLKSAKIVGESEVDGYVFSHSAAFINGKFIGLCVDFKGDEKWQDRVKKWAKSLKF